MPAGVRPLLSVQGARRRPARRPIAPAFLAAPVALAPVPDPAGEAPLVAPGTAAPPPASAAQRLRAHAWDPRLVVAGDGSILAAPPADRLEKRLGSGMKAMKDSTEAARRDLLYGQNRGCGAAGEACGIDAAGDGVPSALASRAALTTVEVTRAGADASPLRRDPLTRSTAKWLVIHDAAFRAELRRILDDRARAIRERKDSARRSEKRTPPGP